MERPRILFTGDSITDAGRNRGDIYDLGCGYPMFAASLYRAENPAGKAEFLNRGVSGDRVRDLAVRWQEDCIALRPDVLSVLIGINDVWRRYSGGDPTECEDFERCYANLLGEVRQRLPDTKIILMEPFLLPVSKEKESWREDLDPKIQAVRRLAAEYAHELIPLDGIFAAAAAVSCAKNWAEDGVHPTAQGAALIAVRWLAAFSNLMRREGWTYGL